MQNILQKCISFIFPPICLYCKKLERENPFQFCSSCTENILQVLENAALQKDSQIIYLFNQKKIGRCLYSQMKNYRMHRALSSFFIVALQSLNWPWPTRIIYPQKGIFSFAENLFVREIKKMIKLPISKIKDETQRPFLYFYPCLNRKNIEMISLEKDSYHFIFFLED